MDFSRRPNVSTSPFGCIISWRDAATVEADITQWFVSEHAKACPMTVRDQE